jgi:hypothetical protein
MSGNLDCAANRFAILTEMNVAKEGSEEMVGATPKKP